MLTMYLRNARGPRLRHLGAEMQTHAGDLLAIGEEAFPHLTSLDASMYAASNDLAARDNRFARFVAGQSFRQLRQLRLGALREDEVSTLGAVDTALDRLEVRRANLGPLLRAGALSPLVRWQLRTEGLSRN